MSSLVEAELKGGLVDGAVLLEEWEPQDREHFGSFVQLWIGSKGNDRFDAFETWVCSPSWLVNTVAAGGRAGQKFLTMPDVLVATCGLWVFRHWSREDFNDAVQQVIDAASPGPDWGAVASRIGRTIPWEYDYLYDEQVNRGDGHPFPSQG